MATARAWPTCPSSPPSIELGIPATALGGGGARDASAVREAAEAVVTAFAVLPAAAGVVAAREEAGPPPLLLAPLPLALAAFVGGLPAVGRPIDPLAPDAVWPSRGDSAESGAAVARGVVEAAGDVATAAGGGTVFAAGVAVVAVGNAGAGLADVDALAAEDTSAGAASLDGPCSTGVRTGAGKTAQAAQPEHPPEGALHVRGVHQRSHLGFSTSLEI